MLVNQGAGAGRLLRRAGRRGRRRQAGQQLAPAGRAADAQGAAHAIDQFPIRPPALAELIAACRPANSTPGRGREVFIEMLGSGQSAAEVMRPAGSTRSTRAELIAICREVVAANPKIVADVKGGKQQAAGNLVGQVEEAQPERQPRPRPRDLPRTDREDVGFRTLVLRR